MFKTSSKFQYSLFVLPVDLKIEQFYFSDKLLNKPLTLGVGLYVRVHDCYQFVVIKEGNIFYYFGLNFGQDF